MVSNMGCASKSQYINIQNPKKSPFNNMDLVWKKDVQHGRAHIIEVECACIPHARILEFLNSEMGSFTRKCKNAKNPKPPRPYLV
jgi:hypothetical protein